MLYQCWSPAPDFRVLLALEYVLIIKTWKGASEAVSMAAVGRPCSPPLAGHHAWLSEEWMTCLQQHLLLESTLDSCDLATSQGRLGSLTPQNIQA